MCYLLGKYEQKKSKLLTLLVPPTIISFPDCSTLLRVFFCFVLCTFHHIALVPFTRNVFVLLLLLVKPSPHNTSLLPKGV